MLNAHRALKLARAACGALKRCLLRVVLAEQRFLRLRPELVQVPAQPQDNFFRVQLFAGRVGRAVLHAPSAFYARVRLQAYELRQVSSTNQPEILVATQRRNVRELASRKKDG